MLSPEISPPDLTGPLVLVRRGSHIQNLETAFTAPGLHSRFLIQALLRAALLTVRESSSQGAPPLLNVLDFPDQQALPEILRIQAGIAHWPGMQTNTFFRIHIIIIINHRSIMPKMTEISLRVEMVAITRIRYHGNPCPRSTLRGTWRHSRMPLATVAMEMIQITLGTAVVSHNGGRFLRSIPPDKRNMKWYS